MSIPKHIKGGARRLKERVKKDKREQEQEYLRLKKEILESTGRHDLIDLLYPFIFEHPEYKFGFGRFIKENRGSKYLDPFSKESQT